MIPCPFLQYYGKCGPYVAGPEVRIDEETGKLKYPGDLDYNKAWKCDESCLLNSHFVEEYCAMFSEERGSWWPLYNIKNSGDPYLSFIKKPQPGKDYIVAVDWGRLYNATQVGVWETDGKQITLRAYKEFEPSRVTKEVAQTIKPMFKAVRDFLFPFDEQTLRYYFDITGDKNGLFGDLLINGYANVPGFKKSKIVRNETAEKNKTWGLWCANDVFNSDLKQNLKSQFLANNIHVPQKQPFWDNYIWEFEHCQVEKTGSGHLTFKEPKKGRRGIDILDMCSFAAWHLQRKRIGPAYLGFSIGRKGRKNRVPKWKNMEE